MAELDRFDIANPEEGGGQAVGHHRVTGDLEKAVATDAFSDRYRLRQGALIADDGGPHDDPPGVHKNRAGRLAGQANPNNLATGGARHLGQRSLRRAPPLGGILLEPAGRLAIRVVLGGGRRVDGARVIDGDRRGPRRPDVETEEHYPAEVGGTASCCDQ